MHKNISAPLLLICILWGGLCKDLFVDLNFDGQPTTANYICIREKFGHMGLYIYIDANGVTNSSVSTFVNAKNAGLTLEIAIAPCKLLTPQNIVNDLVNKLGKNTVDRVWVFPQSTFEECIMSRQDPSVNCLYLVNVVLALKAKGFKTGISTITKSWEELFGSLTACPQLLMEPLAWYPIKPEQNGKPDFDLYKQIGGWKKPFSKFYSFQEICGRGLNVFYYE